MLISIVFDLSLFSCRSKTDILYPETKLTITAIEDNNQVAKYAKGAIFDNLQDYLLAKKTNQIFGAFDSTIANSNGVMVFEGMDSDKNYWIHISYRNATIGVEFNNINTTNTFYIH